MHVGVRGERDLGIGAVYLALGAAGVFIAQGYTFGTPRQMGPGFFPTIISGLLILFGIAAIIRGLSVPGPRISAWNFKGMALISGSVVFFGLALVPLGLPIAIFLSTLIAALASEKFRLHWKPIAGLIAFSAVCSVIFVKFLAVPMPLVGTWLQAAQF